MQSTNRMQRNRVDIFCRLSTMHGSVRQTDKQTNKQTDRQTDHGTVTSTDRLRCRIEIGKL